MGRSTIDWGDMKGCEVKDPDQICGGCPRICVQDSGPALEWGEGGGSGWDADLQTFYWKYLKQSKMTQLNSSSPPSINLLLPVNMLFLHLLLV